VKGEGQRTNACSDSFPHFVLRTSHFVVQRPFSANPTKGKTMKHPIRLQSQLLIRRSYKPERVVRRRLEVTFQPTRRVAVLISNHRNTELNNRAASHEIALSG
jgi:hypothetical protein